MALSILFKVGVPLWIMMYKTFKVLYIVYIVNIISTGRYWMLHGSVLYNKLSFKGFLRFLGVIIKAALHLEAGPICCVRGLKSSLVIGQKG